jgi:hypothetical protein
MLSELLLQNLCNLRNLRMMFSISDFSGKAYQVPKNKKDRQECLSY